MVRPSLNMLVLELKYGVIMLLRGRLGSKLGSFFFLPKEIIWIQKVTKYTGTVDIENILQYFTFSYGEASSQNQKVFFSRHHYG